MNNVAIKDPATREQITDKVESSQCRVTPVSGANWSSNESAARLYASKVYPVKSSNGSTIIVSGTDNGLRFVWSGGKPLFEGPDALPAANGHKRLEPGHIGEEPDSDDESLFDSDDEDLDESHPYPSITQEFDISLGSPVLHVAVPPLLSHEHDEGLPALLFENIVVAIACEDGSAHVVVLPLTPPSASAKQRGRLAAQVVPLDPGSGGEFDLALGIALTAVMDADDGEERYELRHENEQTRLDGHLVVALATSRGSGSLKLYSLLITSADGKRQVHAKGKTSLVFTEVLDSLPTSIAFSTLASDGPDDQLLVAGIDGLVSIYNVVASPHSTAGVLAIELEKDVTLSVPYKSSRGDSIIDATHKKILAASWVLSGLAILVLLEDGQVGLYALDAEPPQGLQNPPRPFSFACEAYIGSTSQPTNGLSTSDPRSHKSQLAPMTPNTRRSKSATLFSEQAHAPSSAPRGGIVTVPSVSPSQHPDTAAVLWYGSTVHSIPSIRQFWAQSDRADAGGLTGARSPITALDPELHELLFDVALLDPAAGAPPRTLFGQALPVTRDVLVVSEYHFTILASARSTPVAPPKVDGGPDRALDVRRLEHGQLGVEGMDRMLDDMADRGRRVGFTADEGLE